MGDLDFLEQPQALDSASMASLQDKLEALKVLRERIERGEELLKGLKAQEKELGGVEIPNFLQQFGLNALELTDGSKVTVKEDIQINIPKTDPLKRKKVLTFLARHGGGGLIKDTLSLEDPEISLIEQLNKMGASYVRDQTVNTGSAKAFMRGLLGLKKNTIARVEPGEVPEEMNLFIFKSTTIKE